jgi:N-acetylmuramoyl-L-alanine amidase
MTNQFLRSIGVRFAFACAVLALLATPARAQQQRGTVVIDAGHGGHDRGGVPGQRVSEKMMALDVAQRLRAYLQSNGYRVVMTRNSDVFIPLGTRTAIANSYRGAKFVSVHFNSARRSGASGIETYYFRGDAAGLATNIHRNVVAVAPTENRGIRRRGYYVLRRTAIPGVLCELGFLTNPYEARYALNPAYRQKLAEAIGRGVQGYRAPMTKPLNPGSAASVDVLPQSLAGPDFVRAAPRPRRYSRRSSRYSRRSSRASQRSKASRRKSSTRRKSSSSKRRKRTSQIEFIKVTADWRIC